MAKVSKTDKANFKKWKKVNDDHQKRMRAKYAKKPKKAVVKQNIFKTEYKDRVSQQIGVDIVSNTASVINGPENSQILIPSSFTDPFTQGSQNGMIDGNQLNSRFLNMKVELNFANLAPWVTSNTVVLQRQNYHIVVRQCLILDDISEAMVYEYTNPSSGRVQKAFNDLAAAADNRYRDQFLKIAKKRLFNQNINPDFLSYERRQDTKVRILKTITVKPSLDTRTSDGRVEQEIPSGGAIVHWQSAPIKRYSFNWKTPKDKVTLQPVINSEHPTLNVPPMGVGKSWIPCVCITMERDIPDDNPTNHNLEINYRDHYTYTDN